MGSIYNLLKKQFQKHIKNHWYESYWAIDMHGVITTPNYQIDAPDIEFPDYAKKALQLMTIRKDIRLILFTSSYPDQVAKYLNQLKRYGIKFDYVNENPEIRSFEDFGYYEDKPYYDVFLEDKAGFEMAEWSEILTFLQIDYPRPSKAWINPKRKRLTNEELTKNRRRKMENIKEQLTKKI